MTRLHQRPKRTTATCPSCLHPVHYGVCTITRRQAKGRPWQCGCTKPAKPTYQP